ncbi:MAG: SMC-Scp complex subunit ScpB [Candidatus Omnitrophica bacterium]|nr:SMC-Scp complex subunit ScpB [Candidatus Omnitrophota bacterium]
MPGPYNPTFDKMENISKIKTIIEALLIVSEDGLNREDIQRAIESADHKDIDEALDSLKREYASPERGFSIAEIAGRCRIVSKPEYMPWISNLYQKDPAKLTGPSLETLAIIAYKQPVTRAEIESVRGVNIGGMLKTILDKELIQIKGRREAPGRPLVYGTTEKFLELFGLNSLDDLPALREFSEEDLDFGKPTLVPVDPDLNKEDPVRQEGAFNDRSDEGEEKEEYENIPEEGESGLIGLKGVPVDDENGNAENVNEGTEGDEPKETQGS